ncbi:DnaJ domain [Musa troglodytarum]|uniref:DnaJ domain n=1 Tax=Musa troglodytarum TaxID=320322 RepID=A0A9E7H5N9_9LILI|nr:DnaJ domain [Musa troglodytarum]
MAMSMGMSGSMGAVSASSMGIYAGRSRVSRGRRSGGDVRCAASTGRLTEQYRTLRVRPGASEKEIKKAFRQLALQYHPDVCKGSNCSVQFHRINEAYDIVMSSLRGPQEEEDRWNDDADEAMRGMNDPSWDLWEEWMGWEGAGIRDYSSHINPYI